MRVFVGVPLPDSFREWMQDFEVASRRLGLSVRTVPPGTCHVTLHFLGDMRPLEVDVLKGLLETAVARHSVADVNLDCLGVFRHGDSPSVVWAGCSRENGAMSELAADVVEVCSSITRRNRERFFLHVTLARFIESRRFAQTDTVSRAFPGPFAFCASQVVLFESILGQGAPEYRGLFSIPLSPVVE